MVHVIFETSQNVSWPQYWNKMQWKGTKRHRQLVRVQDPRYHTYVVLVLSTPNFSTLLYTQLYSSYRSFCVWQVHRKTQNDMENYRVTFIYPISVLVSVSEWQIALLFALHRVIFELEATLKRARNDHKMTLNTPNWLTCRTFNTFSIAPHINFCHM